MLQDLDHPSTPLAPAIEHLKPSSTILSPPPDPEDSHQPYDDHRLSRRDIPAALLVQSSDALSPPPDKPSFPNPSFHRRANTEIIRRQTPHLPARQLFADQPKTFEDLDKTSSLSTENGPRRKFEEGAKLISGWFQGKSQPVSLGVVYPPTDQESSETPANMYSSPSTPTVPTSRAQKRMTAPSPLKQVTSSNPFSFFGLKRQEESRTDLPEPAEDEFLNMDITAALFPPTSGGLNDQEAFDALRNNADSVIRRLQAAYKQRTFALHEALADKNEKQEELEETRTRVGHLKVQLDGMAEKVLQQEKAVKAMAEELEQEREMRRREDEARRRSVMLIRSSDDESSDLGGDLQTPKRSLKRASNATFTSDSGFDSGDESLSESVFSRREGVESPASTVAPSPNISQVTLSTPTTTPVQSQKELKPTPASTPSSTPRPSAYDRVLKGLASTGITSSWNSSKCQICHGVPASEAWSVMGILKEENKGLKDRLGELEMVIDDCLCLVGP
ncbi:uncharacterized protein KD926_007869 [Aspergillus affinis]|uniref:uncharacterized protein n=1 Tax=Aspergillus affinis TaxID=1070780 RepID=UPI0022FDB633|nr:uncharacterized protein KD926_007869 [Aspergillus affinis]KAI9040653.1 hypothetical protein KD926_007869 [Aspergillus affinis]